VQSKCGWSPMTGETFDWHVCQTLCNGHVVYDEGRFDDSYRGEALHFARDRRQPDHQSQARKEEA
jgi:dihydroorotase